MKNTNKIAKIFIKFIIMLTVIIIVAILLLLHSCGFFKPKHKIIEYKEEVKLSNGEMIWVDIKRHYGWSGYAPGMSDGAYMPSVVEISWDTGFEGVGRRSVFFNKRIYIIDKISDEWYIVGDSYPYHGSKDGVNAINCKDVGTLVNRGHDCVFRINKQGELVNKPLQTQDFKDINMNILDVDSIYGSPLPPQNLDGAKLSWSEKVNLKNSNSEGYGLINRPYSYLNIKN